MNRMAMDLSWTSCAIEGSIIQKNEYVAILAAFNQDKEYRDEDEFELVNHMRVVIELIFKIQYPHQITEEFTKRILHSSLGLIRLRPEQHGSYRCVELTIPSSNASPGFAKAAEVVEKMADLFSQFHLLVESGEHHPFYLASFLHFNFVQIHPFRDGYLMDVLEGY